MAITGLKQSLQFALPKSVVFLISDAGAKDFQLEAEVAEVLKAKQIQANFIIEFCHFFMYKRDICKVYHNLAKLSSGQFYRIKKDEKVIDGIINSISLSLDPKQAKLLEIIKVRRFLRGV